jgi:hypothetical protein
MFTRIAAVAVFTLLGCAGGTTLATSPTHTADAMTHAHSHTNRLANEKSPYLLQHAHNPVDWYPWGDEAFEKARREDKPVFLSIGYATCHWCHVMERESFETEAVAKVLNDWFVSIKVDREERPDVDAIYMSAVVGLTGHGGWPMSSSFSSHVDVTECASSTGTETESRCGRNDWSVGVSAISRRAMRASRCA